MASTSAPRNGKTVTTSASASRVSPVEAEIREDDLQARALGGRTELVIFPEHDSYFDAAGAGLLSSSASASAATKPSPSPSPSSEPSVEDLRHLVEVHERALERARVDRARRGAEALDAAVWRRAETAARLGDDFLLVGLDDARVFARTRNRETNVPDEDWARLLDLERDDDALQNLLDTANVSTKRSCIEGLAARRRLELRWATSLIVGGGGGGSGGGNGGGGSSISGAGGAAVVAVLAWTRSVEDMDRVLSSVRAQRFELCHSDAASVTSTTTATSSTATSTTATTMLTTLVRGASRLARLVTGRGASASIGVEDGRRV